MLCSTIGRFYVEILFQLLVIFRLLLKEVSCTDSYSESVDVWSNIKKREWKKDKKWAKEKAKHLLVNVKSRDPLIRRVR